VRQKPDSSPVCDADEAAEQIIVAGLQTHFAHLPVIAEEAASHGAPSAIGGAFFLVDPLDGTREFLNGSQDFTVNIALIVDGAPRAGVVYAPRLSRLWVGSDLDPAGPLAIAGDAEPGQEPPALEAMTPVRARAPKAGELAALISRSHLDARSQAFLDSQGVSARTAMGSSLKFCLLAEGQADVYPRFGPTMEWDTAAGDAVLRAAGGLVVDEDGRPLSYGHPELGFRNPCFIAWGRAAR
jgi:3'(2'),5'-bisphosphate nucleotidase